MKTCCSAAICIAILGLAQFRSWAQAGASTKAAVYSAVQAARGEAIYNKRCVSCHGEQLDGQAQIPGLAGDQFEQMWLGKTLDEMFDRIQNGMPSDKPGTLTREQTAAVVAYILKANKLPAGSSDLPSDTEKLKSIKIEPAN